MKKIETIIFIAVVLVMISIPGVFTNIKSNQTSKMDNRMLQEFPSMDDEGFQKDVELYLSDRVGFRENMITLYQTLCDKVFSKLVYPLYAYGKDGHVMMTHDLTTFQHADVDQNYVENLGEYLKSLEDFCGSMGSEFLFFLCPNKESIYPEYFPDGYFVKEQPNRSDRIAEALTKKKVPFIFPRELFMELKNEELLYNQKYDAAHWNDTGCFYGNREIINYLGRSFPTIGELEKEEFQINEVVQPYLKNSYFRIDERVPDYTLKKTDSAEEPDVFSQIELTAPQLHHQYYRNTENQELPRILIFGDSYFEYVSKFYLNHSFELMSLHSDNMKNAEYYISLFQPDIVIVEFVERVLQVPNAIDDERIAKRFPSGAYEEKIEQGIQIESYNTRGNKFISVYGSFDDLDQKMMLKAVVNEKAYYAKRDGNTFCFTFKREDILENHRIDFYKCYEPEN